MKSGGGMDEKVRLFFDAMADTHRMRIVDMLIEKDMNVSQICAHFSMKQPSVSHHLAVLKKGGVVKAQRRGKEILYSINRKFASSVMTYYFARFGFAIKEVE